MLGEGKLQRKTFMASLVLITAFMVSGAALAQDNPAIENRGGGPRSQA